MSILTQTKFKIAYSIFILIFVGTFADTFARQASSADDLLISEPGKIVQALNDHAEYLKFTLRYESEEEEVFLVAKEEEIEYEMSFISRLMEAAEDNSLVIFKYRHVTNQKLKEVLDLESLEEGLVERSGLTDPTQITPWGTIIRFGHGSDHSTFVMKTESGEVLKFILYPDKWKNRDPPLNGHVQYQLSAKERIRLTYIPGENGEPDEIIEMEVEGREEEMRRKE